MTEPTLLHDDTLKALVEAILYVSPEPVTLDMLVKALKPEARERVKVALEGLVEEYARNEHGIQIRPVAGGWKFSSKAEHHEILRDFVKSLKPPIRLTKPSLEVLAVIAYRQPITVPEINDVRGVDCGGVIHTLLERKLIVTAGRKNVVGRPILYRTSRDFLVHFGLKDLGEMPSLREFEEMARQALGSELLPPDELPSGAETAVLQAQHTPPAGGDEASGHPIKSGTELADDEPEGGSGPEAGDGASGEGGESTPPASDEA
ncbi:MAG TPA: SMC-Scp complex subunit ScpB [Terriglobia bacterium]|nr:SMC-Scp complex subunit ScpB [Terriglobia bacterium]